MTSLVQAPPSREQLSVLHCISGLDARFGGPSRSVVQLSEALASCAGVTVTLLGQHRAPGLPTIRSTGRLQVKVLRVGSSAALASGLPIRGALAAIMPAARPDVLHSHGIWQGAPHWIAAKARAWSVPLVVQPRGMLEPWALRQKAWRKRLALALYQRRDLETARALVATSVKEAENLRGLGLRQPLAVIPNGVDFAALGEHQPKQPRDAGHPRTALFLSRLHPKKGVLDLLSAWARLAPVGWRLLIAGPDEAGHGGEVRRRIEQLGLASAVECLGAVEGAEKARLYRDADLFVLPTAGESFGLVIAEALACGVPVITTRGAPWEDLLAYRCGWWIGMGVEPLRAALREATALTDEERAAMGERGRAYVQRYQWSEVAAQTLRLYRWLLGQGPRPDFVLED